MRIVAGLNRNKRTMPQILTKDLRNEKNLTDE